MENDLERELDGLLKDPDTREKLFKFALSESGNRLWLPQLALTVGAGLSVAGIRNRGDKGDAYLDFLRKIRDLGSRLREDGSEASSEDFNLLADAMERLAQEFRKF